MKPSGLERKWNISKSVAQGRARNDFLLRGVRQSDEQWKVKEAIFISRIIKAVT